MPDPQGYPIFELTNLQDTIVHQVWSDGTIVFSTGVELQSGNGSPNGVVTAPPSSLYFQRDGVAPNQLWQKQVGIDNNGWVNIGTGGGGGGTTTNPLTINNSGTGAASGTTFNGAAPVTISYNSIGAAPLASPVFTGTPQAPTPLTADNSTNIATTAFVKAQGYAPLASPTFTGLVTTPTSALAGAGLNVPQGAVPTSPNNGDIWTTSGGFFVRINGATQQLGATTNNCTFNNSGAGVASGTSFNGLAARTISYNTLGAAPTASPTFTGTVTLPAAITLANTTTLSPTSGSLITWVMPANDSFLFQGTGAQGTSQIALSGGTISIRGGNGAGSATVIIDGNGVGTQINSTIVQYNSIGLQRANAPFGQGIVIMPNCDNQAALTANYNAGSAFTLVTPTAVSLYRVAGVQAINRAATTSSTMPSLTLSWTDPGGIARTATLVATSATNATSVETPFERVIHTNGSTPVTITSAGYASSGATSMQYSLGYAIEQLG